MKGFMRRRGDAWELRAYLGGDPVTGKQRYAGRTVRGGTREAQLVLNDMSVTSLRPAATNAGSPPAATSLAATAIPGP